MPDYKLVRDGEVKAVLKNPSEAMKQRLAEQGWTLEEGTKELPDRRTFDDKMNVVRARRNAKLAEFEWTIGQASPLSPANRAEWLQYLRDLHKVTKDLDDPDLAVWPIEPELRYAVT